LFFCVVSFSLSADIVKRQTSSAVAKQARDARPRRPYHLKISSS